MDRLSEHVRDVLSGRQRGVITDDGLKPSAVLLLIYEKDKEYHMLFTKRTSLVEDHKGEVSFPGGAFHSGEDHTLQETALRESAEEVGLASADVEVLGELDDEITRSRYIISPFVGISHKPQKFQPFEIEVAKIIEVPLRVLLDPQTLHEEPREYAGRPINGFYYLYGEDVIWGVTARILSKFLGMAFQGEDAALFSSPLPKV